MIVDGALTPNLSREEREREQGLIAAAPQLKLIPL
jgi:hypothetical protein